MHVILEFQHNLLLVEILEQLATARCCVEKRAHGITVE
jgi:hypothetical protein